MILYLCILLNNKKYMNFEIFMKAINLSKDTLINIKDIIHPRINNTENIIYQSFKEDYDEYKEMLERWEFPDIALYSEIESAVNYIVYDFLSNYLFIDDYEKWFNDFITTHYVSDWESNILIKEVLEKNEIINTYHHEIPLTQLSDKDGDVFYGDIYEQIVSEKDVSLFNKEWEVIDEHILKKIWIIWNFIKNKLNLATEINSLNDLDWLFLTDECIQDLLKDEDVTIEWETPKMLCGWMYSFKKSMKDKRITFEFFNIEKELNFSNWLDEFGLRLFAFECGLMLLNNVILLTTYIPYRASFDINDDFYIDLFKNDLEWNQRHFLVDVMSLGEQVLQNKDENNLYEDVYNNLYWSEKVISMNDLKNIEKFTEMLKKYAINIENDKDILNIDYICE